jgi:hypothetical protein
MKNSYLLVALWFVLVPIPGRAGEDLASKIVRAPLNQAEPAIIKVGLKGITTIEFPARIEALDGFGFSPNPVPGGPDLFQISFNKGTNFLSLKAVRPNAEGNLSVVLNSKVYCLLCKESPDPSFAVIFEESAQRGDGVATGSLPPALKAVSPGRLLGFLDKVKGFPALKVSAAEMYKNMDVAEPDSLSSADGLDIFLKRVIRDDTLDSVGFEVELRNATDRDFYYDPEGFSVRVKDEVYPQSVSDAAGLVPAGKTQAAFFVVTGTANGGRNDLAVTNRFEVLIRAINAELDPQHKASAEWQEPPDRLPTNSAGHAATPGSAEAQKTAAPETRVAAARQQKKKGKKVNE